MIQRALVDLRVLGVGRGVTKAHTDVAFPYLREIVDSWQMNRWAVFRVDRTRFALIAGTSEYTIGPGGTLLVKDTPNSVATAPLSYKPHWLTSAKSNQPGEDFEYPVTMWSRRRWLDDERPRAIYMEAGITNNTVHLWPVPESPAYDLILGLPVTFSAFADLDTQYPLQEGYHYALRTRLRNQIGTPFGKPPSPMMIGSRTTETWYNSGDALSPFAPAQGEIIDAGMGPLETTQFVGGAPWGTGDPPPARRSPLTGQPRRGTWKPSRRG